VRVFMALAWLKWATIGTANDCVARRAEAKGQASPPETHSPRHEARTQRHAEQQAAHGAGQRVGTRDAHDTSSTLIAGIVPGHWKPFEAPFFHSIAPMRMTSRQRPSFNFAHSIPAACNISRQDAKGDSERMKASNRSSATASNSA